MTYTSMKQTSAEKEKNEKRLSIDMKLEMHKSLKVISARRNCTMRKLVIRAIAEFVRKENEVNTEL